MAQDIDEREDEPTGEEQPDENASEGQDAPPHEHIEGVDDGCGK
jgi:hypothetical protein